MRDGMTAVPTLVGGKPSCVVLHRAPEAAGESGVTAATAIAAIAIGISPIRTNTKTATPLEGPAAWACCIGGAVSKQDYVDLISSPGLEVTDTSDHSEALTATIEKVRRRLSLFEISTALGDLDLRDLGVSPDAFERARRIATALIEEVRKGALGYVLLTAVNP